MSIPQYVILTNESGIRKKYALSMTALVTLLKKQYEDIN